MVVGSRVHGPGSILAVFAVLGLGMLPREHIHAARSEHGRDHPLLHSHLEPHHLPDSRAAMHADDDDADVVWIGAVFTPHAAVRIFVPDAVAPAPAPRALPVWTASPPRRRGNATVHGPPGRAVDSPRAPPSLRLA